MDVNILQVSNFWFGQLCLLLILFLTSFVLGLLVERKNVRVNYVRKVLPFVLMFSSSILFEYFPYSPSTGSTVLVASLFLLWMGSFAGPFRNRSSFLNTCFQSIDRPEDRPYTLLWFSTQTVCAYIAYLLVLAWLHTYDMAVLISITVIVSGIGDSLAEPVGVRFGKKTYKTKAIFIDRYYTRSYVGSACVFLSAVMGVLYVGSYLTAEQMLLSLFVMPPVFALTEAMSPHTWDQPFIVLVGGALTVAMLEVSAGWG